MDGWWLKVESSDSGIWDQRVGTIGFNRRLSLSAWTSVEELVALGVTAASGGENRKHNQEILPPATSSLRVILFPSLYHLVSMAARNQSKAANYQSNSQLPWSWSWRTKRTVSFVVHGANDRSARQSEIMEGPSVTLIAEWVMCCGILRDSDGGSWSHTVAVKILPRWGSSVANVIVFILCLSTRTYMQSSVEPHPTETVVKTENSTLKDCLKLIMTK